MKLGKKQKNELIRILKDSKLCVRMVGHDYLKDETMLFYCAELEKDISRWIEKLEK